MTTKERLDRHDKQIAVIRDLVKSGMQMVIATREDIRETRKDLRALVAAQKRTEANLQRTEAKLEALIDTLRRSGGNGHSKTKIEL